MPWQNTFHGGAVGVMKLIWCLYDTSIIVYKPPWSSEHSIDRWVRSFDQIFKSIKLHTYIYLISRRRRDPLTPYTSTAGGGSLIRSKSDGWCYKLLEVHSLIYCLNMVTHTRLDLQVLACWHIRYHRHITHHTSPCLKITSVSTTTPRSTTCAALTTRNNTTWLASWCRIKSTGILLHD
jgi:hypothetical protein